jgi:Transcriptional regulator
VLQAINRAGALTMADIAEASGVPYPTAFRIVQTLLHEGLIEREPARKLYRPTALAQTLSHGFQDHGRLVTVARSHIVALTKKVGWPVTIATHVGHRMVIRDSTHALTSLTFNNYYPGYTLPILECAVGRAYLSHVPEDERRSILKALRAVPENVERHALKMFESGELPEKILRDGYAGTWNNLFTQNPGKTSSMAVPLFEKGHVVGALALVFFSSALKLHEAAPRYLADVRQTAADISQALDDAEATLAHHQD